jgi:hypothetical protein
VPSRRTLARWRGLRDGGNGRGHPVRLPIATEWRRGAAAAGKAQDSSMCALTPRG